MSDREKVRITPRRFTYLTDGEKKSLMKSMYPECEVVDTEYGHLYVIKKRK